MEFRKVSLMRRNLSTGLLLSLLAIPLVATAQEEEEDESAGAPPRLGQSPGERFDARSRIGLDPLRVSEKLVPRLVVWE